MTVSAVQREEGRLAWFRQLGGAVAAKVCTRAWAGVHPDPADGPAPATWDCPEEARQWYAFENADAMEQGLAPGLATSFVEPPKDDEHLLVHRSQDRREYVLKAAGGSGNKGGGGSPILLARQSEDGSSFSIFVAGDGEPPRALGPAFTVSATSAARDEWSLYSERCDQCESRGKRVCGRRGLARMRHYVELMGEGKAFCMDLAAPDESSVWCPACGGNPEDWTIKELTTRRPRWNPRQRTLTLDFHGRCSRASAKNFMLQERRENGSVRSRRDVRLLLGKVRDDLFALEFGRPLGTVQAFAAALTAMHWR